MAVILVSINMALYFPFIKTLDRKYLEDEANAEANAGEEEEISFDDLDLDDL